MVSTRFPDFMLNYSEILWKLCSVDFHTLTLQLLIQTLHSVAPELQVFVSSLSNCQTVKISAKRAHPRILLFESGILRLLNHVWNSACHAGCLEAESQGTCVTYTSAKCE